MPCAIVSGSRAAALIWIMGSVGAPATFPYIRGSATSNAAALTALGGKLWAAVGAYHWRSAAQLERIHHPAKRGMLPVTRCDTMRQPAVSG